MQSLGLACFCQLSYGLEAKWKRVLYALQSSYSWCSRSQVPGSKRKSVWPARYSPSPTQRSYHVNLPLGLSESGYVLRDLRCEHGIYGKSPFLISSSPQNASFGREFALRLKLWFPQESHHNLFFFDVFRRWVRSPNHWSSALTKRCRLLRGQAISGFHQRLPTRRPCDPSSRSEVVCAALS